MVSFLYIFLSELEYTLPSPCMLPQSLLYLHLGGISVCDSCVVHLLVEFNVVVCNLPISMLHERNVPRDRHNVGCLEVMCDVSRRPTWRSFRCQQVFDGFLAKSNVILTCHSKFILNPSLYNVNKQTNIRFKVLTVAGLKISVFWHAKCSCIDMYKALWNICIYLPNYMVSLPRRQKSLHNTVRLGTTC